MPKHSILILVLYFGEYRIYQKYRIINRIYVQELHKKPTTKETPSLLIMLQFS